MRDARLARGLVDRADLVIDHMRDHRRAMIGNHHDLEAVFEREALRIEHFRPRGHREGEKSENHGETGKEGTGTHHSLRISQTTLEDDRLHCLRLRPSESTSVNSAAAQ